MKKTILSMAMLLAPHDPAVRIELDPPDLLTEGLHGIDPALRALARINGRVRRAELRPDL